MLGSRMEAWEWIAWGWLGFGHQHVVVLGYGSDSDTLFLFSFTGLLACVLAHDGGRSHPQACAHPPSYFLAVHSKPTDTS